MLLWFALALAAPDDPAFPRAEDRVRVRRFNAIVGRGPYWPKGPNKSGAVEAWIFDDLQVEHYHRSERGKRVATVQFDVHSQVWAELGWATDGRLLSARIQGREQPVAGWTAWTLGGLSGWGPEAPEVVEGAVRWTLPEGRLSLVWSSASVTPFTAAYEAELREGCACELLDHRTLFVDGHAGAHHRALLAHLAEPLPAELVAVPLGEGALLASWHGAKPTASDGASVPPADTLYAVLATLSWTAP